MQFNQKIGKQFFHTQIGVTKNTGVGTGKMAERYNGNLRNKPRDPEVVHAERRIKLLENALKQAQKK